MTHDVAPPATVSRRRIVQGALWATPAVLVATALPAAAASPPRLGGLAITTARGFQNTTTLTVSTYVSYVGDGGASPDHPVSAITVTIAVPTSRVATGAGTTSSPTWAYTSRSVSGSNTLFVFTRTGANLSASNPITNQLVVVLPKSADRSAFAVSVTAGGTSNATPVTSPAQNVNIGAYALLTIPNGLAATRDPYSGGARFMHFVAPVLNSSSPVSAPVVGLTAVLTVPTASTAAGNGTVGAGPWTFASRVVSGATTVFTFNYTGGTLVASGTNTAASFNLPMTTSLYLQTPSVSITFSGTSPTAADAVTSATASDTLGLNI